MPSFLAYNMEALWQEFGCHGVGGQWSNFLLKHIENDFVLWNQGSMHFEGDMHHVDMQFVFSMIHINDISLITVCAFSHKPCLGNYRTSAALGRLIFLSF